MRVPNDLQLDSGSYLLFALFYESNPVVRRGRPSAAVFLQACKSNVEIACRVAAWLGLAAPAMDSAFGWKATPLLVDLIVQQRGGLRRGKKSYFFGVKTMVDTIVESALGNCGTLSLECEYCLCQFLVVIGLMRLGDDEDEWVPTQRLLDLVGERRKWQAGDEADEDDLAG